MYMLRSITCMRNRASQHNATAYATPEASNNRLLLCGHQRGVTLIEMLIVLIIISVLLTMVVPAYNRYFTDARRADAHDMLQKNARILQNCLTLAGAFDAGCDLLTVSSDGHYVLSQTVTQNTWQLSAVPEPSGPQASDSDCTMITLDHIGRKTATGLNPEQCW